VELSQKTSVLEREKLLEHLHHSDEGVAFFNSSFENISANTHFIQYLNTLLNEPTFDVCDLFESPIFGDVLHFIENQSNKKVFNGKLYSNGCQFRVRVIIFDDRSFEIIIRNISATEKADFDRARLTNNVAHELRTPVTSVMGYLETLITHENLDEEKRKEFIQKAYNQTVRLSEIIQDVVLLSKTSTAPHSFLIENINISELLKDLIETDIRESIEKRNCTVIVSIPEDVVVRGNCTLIQSIFYNLCTNALKYAGENITITIRNYMEDDEYYYFSFSDNGTGIDNKHLDHIFERFYRITEGRTRDKGGSGLGLAIVKDAVNFHKGAILAKNRAEGGLEFLFTLQKK
jgi:signal transduction histidine kinase